MYIWMFNEKQMVPEISNLHLTKTVLEMLLVYTFTALNTAPF